MLTDFDLFIDLWNFISVLRLIQFFILDFKAWKFKTRYLIRYFLTNLKVLNTYWHNYLWIWQSNFTKIRSKHNHSKLYFNNTNSYNFYFQPQTFEKIIQITILYICYCCNILWLKNSYHNLTWAFEMTIGP